MNARQFLFSVLFLSLLSIPAFSAWTEPEPVFEVNSDFEEWSPFLSYDGLTLYFSRVRTPESYYGRIFEATREEPEGEFTNVRELPGELNAPPYHVLCPWVSPDNLRMYYHKEQTGVGWRLMLSERESINDPWPEGREIEELNALGKFLQLPRLTPDEKVMYFQSTDIPGGKGGQDAWVATRSDKNMPFETIRNMEEINTSLDEGNVCISPDSLTMYFMKQIDGSYQMFKATRDSINLPFGNVQHLSLFDTENGNSVHPYLSGDGNALYFVKSFDGDRKTQDIYVSYYYPENSYFVDAGIGDDTNSGSSPQNPVATIQKAIDAAPEGYTIFVKPGTYPEAIDFDGKAITIQGLAGPDGVPVLEIPDDIAVTFIKNEGPDSVLKNFVIKNCTTAILIVESSPTISNVTIVDNLYGIKAFGQASPDISNCIFWNNVEGDISGCEAQYSWVQSQLGTDSSYLDIPDLVSYWSFDEASGNVLNDVISDKNGDIIGASWTEGVSGSALSFDGDNDYISFGDILDDEIRDTFTIGVWIKLADGALQKATNYVFWKDDDRPAFHIGSNGQVAFGHWYEGESGLHSSHVLKEEKWYYLVYKYDGSEFTGYVNAEYTGSHPDSGYSPGGNIRIGSDGNSTRYFKGKIDELMIFNRALTDQEVMQIYENQLNGSISGNPLFANPNNGDYHLKSKRGRYWPEHDIWVLDKISSSCIDAGDPSAEPLHEPMPNGGLINMGAYGGTSYASLSEIMSIEPDFNKDGIIDELDLSDLVEEWITASGLLNP